MENKVNDNNDIKSFNNQVGGHSTHGARPIGMVKLGDNFVLKPVTKPRLAHTEITFYQEIWSTEDGIVGLLKQFVPKYHGLITLKLDGNETTFLKLQDVSAGLKKPCIADIKIGAQTWEPNEDHPKRLCEDLKYAETKNAYGISITGYQVFDVRTGEFVKRDKHFGKALTKTSVNDALKEFFNYKTAGSEVVVRYVLRRLSDMLSWWHQQKVVNIYGSSVLILYDAWELDTERRRALDPKSADEPVPELYEPSSESNMSWIRAYMIDFAHVVYPYHATNDKNYLSGLTNLIELIQTL